MSLPGAAASASASGVTDVAGFIDQQPVGRFQIRLLLACAAVLLLDGFDTQGIGCIAPDLARDWSLERGALGPVFSAGLLGNLIGALLFGPIADRIGRKRIIVLCTAAFGLGTLATVFAQDISSLLVILQHPRSFGIWRASAARGDVALVLGAPAPAPTRPLNRSSAPAL